MKIDQVFVRNWQKSFFSICAFLLINLLLIVSQDALALTKPTLQSPSNNATITTTSVTFSWSHPYNDKYEVKIKTNGGTLKYASGKISSKSKTVDLSSIPLTYDSNYKWYVVVYANNQETSSADSWFTYKSDTTKPVVSSFDAAPSSITLGGSFSVNYTVSDTGSGLKQVELWRANDSGGSPSRWAQISTRALTGNGPTTGTFSNIPSAVGAYWYGIHVVDNAGNWVPEPSPRKVSVLAPVVAPPPAPTLNTPSNGATNVAKTNVYFSWDSSAATSYRIIISQNSAFSGFNGSSTCDSTCFTTATTSKSFSQNMALDGKTYYWKVRAYNSAGASGWSVVRSFTTAGVVVSPLFAKVDNFVNTWDGRGTWLGGNYNNFQCVALMRQYLQDVLGLNTSNLPSGSDKSAYSIFANANNSHFSKILYTPTGVPQKGDIIFWNKSASNRYSGHVAIFISGNASSFTSLDQNWYKNDPNRGSVAAKVTHTYSGVAGWLHPK